MVVDAVERAQAPDGYLNTYSQVERPEYRWENLSQGHELYCAGYLFEARSPVARQWATAVS